MTEKEDLLENILIHLDILLFQTSPFNLTKDKILNSAFQLISSKNEALSDPL